MLLHITCMLLHVTCMQLFTCQPPSLVNDSPPSTNNTSVRTRLKKLTTTTLSRNTHVSVEYPQMIAELTWIRITRYNGFGILLGILQLESLGYVIRIRGASIIPLFAGLD